MVTTTERPAARNDAGPVGFWKRGWVRQAWVPLFAMYCVGFGLFGAATLFVPGVAQSTVRANLPWHFPMLLVHVLTGIVAVCLGWLQVWPWLRENHPVIHRRIGWVYFFGGVIPSGILAFPVAVLNIFGQGMRYAFLAMALLWAITTVGGFVSAVQHRFEDHRRWMYRSVAMTTSTITVRFLQPLAINLTTWLLPATYSGQARQAVLEGAAAGLWASFVLHLLFVEWVVLRPRRRRRRRVEVRPARDPGLAFSAPERTG
jgi:hypothetical protein